MELKDICIDLEYAKKLKELGVKQDSIFYWWDWKNKKRQLPDSVRETNGIKLEQGTPAFPSSWIYYSAFTSAELLEWLPKNFDKKYLGIAPSLNNDAYGISYGIYYMSSSQNIEIMKEDKKLPNALAKMLIYLIENKLTEVSK